MRVMLLAFSFDCFCAVWMKGLCGSGGSECTAGSVGSGPEEPVGQMPTSMPLPLEASISSCINLRGWDWLSPSQSDTRRSTEVTQQDLGPLGSLTRLSDILKTQLLRKVELRKMSRKIMGASGKYYVK